ncbi:sensor histidine kinase [Chitinophaga ginsengisoli]|uniref:GHKL domain-containing protein n=1 Tax=Chitinophaga ginsengisoli TaxID=363837 RepID=A0A2P8G0V8_9BACT|nr:histidine kinase [Chitinophaga ginsengisoli]PSL27612.1 GHKL domain-containing protein [Chitinophaga ginsengisoli]
MNALLHNPSKQNWLLRYKLHHIPFWALYHFIWWTVALGNPVKAFAAIFFTAFILKFLFYVIFQALAVYFNLYYLIPKYLEKGRFTQYIVFLLLTIIGVSLLVIPGYYLSAYVSGQTMQQAYGPNGDCFYGYLGNTLPSTLAAMTLAMSIKLGKNWLQTQRKQQLLEKEKLETELNFLKHQFNPHFLFNTINSIFFLIHKNPDMASASLAKFSELLRYQLYECNDKQILLSKEISYMENSIELERLRQNDNVEVILDIDQEDSNQWGIAPFILMTFVENAFKHVSKHTDKPNWIRIRLTQEGETLNFVVSNSTFDVTSNDIVHYGGIGLKNVQRRLDLIYPGQHSLDIQHHNDRFDVRLQLHLTAGELPQPLQKIA